jgi:hypothetical protein
MEAKMAVRDVARAMGKINYRTYCAGSRNFASHSTKHIVPAYEAAMGELLNYEGLSI